MNKNLRWNSSLHQRRFKLIYINNNKLTAITTIPAIRPYIAKWCSPYFLAVGNNSSKDIKTIIPATADNNIPKVISLKIFLNKVYPIIAPIGSDIPDKKEYKKAFFLSPVA